MTENLEHALPFVLVDSASGQRLDEDSTKDSALIDLGLIPGKEERVESGLVMGRRVPEIWVFGF